MAFFFHKILSTTVNIAANSTVKGGMGLFTFLIHNLLIFTTLISA